MYRNFRRICHFSECNQRNSLASAKFLLGVEGKLENLSIYPRNSPEPEYRHLGSSEQAPSSLSKSEKFGFFLSVTCRKLHSPLSASLGKAPGGAKNVICHIPREVAKHFGQHQYIFLHSPRSFGEKRKRKELFYPLVHHSTVP